MLAICMLVETLLHAAEVFKMAVREKAWEEPCSMQGGFCLLGDLWHKAVGLVQDYKVELEIKLPVLHQ